MEIGNQIKKYRGEIKVSQDELAREVYVSRQTISNWENNKSYPDVKSLILLSSLFNVSLDVLVKGDLEKMKKEIKENDINDFKKLSNIFSCLMIALIILPVPTFFIMGKSGGIVIAILFIITFYYSIKVEKLKKNFDIQTYREVVSFLDGKELIDSEKNQEIGKRKYQKVFMVLGAMFITFIVGFIFASIFQVSFW